MLRSQSVFEGGRKGAKGGRKEGGREKGRDISMGFPRTFRNLQRGPVLWLKRYKIPIRALVHVPNTIILGIQIQHVDFRELNSA